MLVDGKCVILRVTEKQGAPRQVAEVPSRCVA